ncbi:DUF4181 domain-containing protein [Neobacillus sp. D3-1R]|uniref:DUF4181 domain-containing protein n=1 Tax=Neobacillus sp. D3-1R TaxID=3445778 RepID=UPI003FA02A21
MNILLLIIVFLIYGLISDWLLRRALKINKSNWAFYKSVNTTHKWIERIIFIGFMILLWFVEDTFLLMIAFFFTLFTVRAFMEWKYERMRKEYLVTLFSIINLILFLSMVTIFS